MRFFITLFAAIGCIVLMGDRVAAQSVDDALGGFDAPASPSSALDDALGGFDDGSATPKLEVSEVAKPSPWSMSGSVSLAVAYDYAQAAPAVGRPDYRGLSRVRPKAAFKLKGDFSDGLRYPVRVLAEGTASHDLVYSMRGRGNYPATVKDSFERDLSLGELYVGAALPNGFELTLGRQIVVWGASDNLRVVDVINPLDRREIGMVDIEDLRLPLTMARVDYVFGPWTATALAIPHIRFDELPPANSPYDPTNGNVLRHDVPGNELGNTEFAARLRGNFSGWDISFHAADIYDDVGHREIVGGSSLIRHPRLNIFGVTADVAHGNWLLKGEAANITGLQTLGVPGKSFMRTDAMAGVEFTGLSDASLGFEVVNRHLHGWSEALAAEGLRRNAQEFALRLSADYLRERLHVTALTTHISPITQGGGFSRVSVEYDLMDALSVTGGIVTYHKGTRLPFHAIANNDRIFFEIKQSF